MSGGYNQLWKLEEEKNNVCKKVQVLKLEAAQAIKNLLLLLFFFCTYLPACLLLRWMRLPFSCVELGKNRLEPGASQAAKWVQLFRDCCSKAGRTVRVLILTLYSYHILLTRVVYLELGLGPCDREVG